MAMADVGDVSLCYETHGDHGNPTIVLIRGLGTQLIEWPPALIEGSRSRGSARSSCSTIATPGCRPE